MSPFVILLYVCVNLVVIIVSCITVSHSSEHRRSALPESFSRTRWKHPSLGRGPQPSTDKVSKFYICCQSRYLVRITSSTEWIGMIPSSLPDFFITGNFQWSDVWHNIVQFSKAVWSEVSRVILHIIALSISNTTEVHTTPCPDKNGLPKHVKITLWVDKDNHYFNLYYEKPSICNVYVKFNDN